LRLTTTGVRTRYLGDTVTVGPYELPYREDPDTDLGFYTTDATEVGLVEGWLGASWAGQWPDYVGTDDLFVPEPILLTAPHAGGAITLASGTQAPIEWVPTGDGDLTLTLRPPFGDAVMYTLNDDGYFAIDADDVIAELGLTSPVVALTATLTR